LPIVSGEPRGDGGVRPGSLSPERIEQRRHRDAEGEPDADAHRDIIDGYPDDRADYDSGGEPAGPVCLRRSSARRMSSSQPAGGISHGVFLQGGKPVQPARWSTRIIASCSRPLLAT
jgi:hypothetical protein